MGCLVLWLSFIYVHHCKLVVCLAAIVRMARFGWLLARSWLCCTVGCLLVVAPCALVTVVVVLAGAGLTSFGPPVPEPKFESYSIHEPLRRELVPPFSPRARPLAALAALAPLALAPLALLAILTLAPPLRL